MEDKKYLDIAKHYDECFKKHGPTHLGVDWPNEQYMHIRNRVMLDIKKFSKASEGKSTILDFGCGFSSMYSLIKEERLENLSYSGLDINKNFYEYCKKTFPEVDFLNCDVLSSDNNQDQIPDFDFIVCNGVFTEKRHLSYKEMMIFFQKVTSILWSKCRVGLSFNLMSKLVDWERDDLFHVSYDELSQFLSKNLSRNFIIRNDYGLYEYTIYVFK